MISSKPQPSEHLNAANLPERWEIVDGEPQPKEATGPRHGRAQGRTFRLLSPFDRRPGPPHRPGGWWFSSETSVTFSPTQVRLPDVAGWRRERMPEMPEGSTTDIIPDWICEILSPSNANDDTIVKMRLYHQAQVKHYWLLDPRTENLQVYRWTADGYLFVLGAVRGETVHAEPFDAIAIKIGVFFGDDEE